jgi:hypothetical protein
MAKWRNSGIAKLNNGEMAKLRNGEIEHWRNGETPKWRNRNWPHGETGEMATLNMANEKIANSLAPVSFSFSAHNRPPA